MVAGDRRRPAASSSNSVMTPPRARRRAASIAEESWAEDIALDAQRESRFASVALAAAVLRICLDAVASTALAHETRRPRAGTPLPAPRDDTQASDGEAGWRYLAAL